MGLFTVGDMVVVPFPYTDLSNSKMRPALIITEIDNNDYILLQITSQRYDDRFSIAINKGDLSEGYLKFDSFVKFSKIFTGNDEIISKSIGKLNEKKINEIIDNLILMVKMRGKKAE
jgi:mRNA interferase MazF